MKTYRLFAFIALFCLPFTGKGQSSLTVSITTNDAKCNGHATGSAIVSSSGGFPPYTYVWTPATIGSGAVASGLAAGVYSVTVRDAHGGRISSAITISEPDPITVFIDSIVVPPCFRTTSGGVCGCTNTLWAVASGGTPPYAYLWSTEGSSVSPGDTLYNACYLEWTVNVTDNNHCINTDSLFVAIPGTHTVTTSTNEITEANGIIVYPSPARDQLNVSFNRPVNGSGLEIFDIQGNKVAEHKLQGNEQLVTFGISALANGNYMLKVTGGDSKTAVHFSVSR